MNPIGMLLSWAGVLVWLPIAWFAIGPVWGFWVWLAAVFLLAERVGKLVILVAVSYLLYSFMPAHAQDRNSGWGAFDPSRGEIYMGQLFDTPSECNSNLSRHRPTYGIWQCRHMTLLAPNQLLVPPANAKEGVRCVKNGGTTVCR